MTIINLADEKARRIKKFEDAAIRRMGDAIEKAAILLDEGQVTSAHEILVAEIERLRGFEDDAKRLHGDKMKYFEALLQIMITCDDNAPSSCDKGMALKFVRDVAARAVGFEQTAERTDK